MDPDSVSSLKVSELKAQLSAKGLETTGVKSTLQQRLRDALASATPAEEPKAEEPKAEEDTIDESTRYSGTVFKFIKRRGFGRIIPDGKTKEDTDDLVFVHWKQIQSDDAWPSLCEGQKVEYYLGKKANPKDPKKAVFAASVTLAGGNKIVHEDTRDFPNRSQRFEGVVDFFNAYKGFGFIKPKEDFNFEEQDFLADKKATIYVCREDINTTDLVDSMPSLKDAAAVEFALYKSTTEDGKVRWAAGDVTMPGGTPLGPDDFKPKPAPGDRKRKRKPSKKKGGKKGKGKNQKFPKNKAFKMGGMSFIPMNQMRQQQPQIVMMNGQAYMVMPQQQQQMGFGGMGGMQMGGMQMMNMGGNLVGFGKQGGRKKKRRKKNKKNVD